MLVRVLYVRMTKIASVLTCYKTWRSKFAQGMAVCDKYRATCAESHGKIAEPRGFVHPFENNPQELEMLRSLLNDSSTPVDSTIDTISSPADSNIAQVL